MQPSSEEYRNTIAQYRNERASSLAFVPSIEHLLDLTTQPNPDLFLVQQNTHWDRYIATPYLADQLPKERGIYMFVWSPGPSFAFGDGKPPFSASWILYVGKAGTPGGQADTFRDRYRTYRRFLEGHPRNLWVRPSGPRSRRELLETYLTLRPLEFWCLSVTDLEYIPTLERRILHLLQPPLNIQNSGPRARLGKPMPAWSRQQ